MTRWCVAAALLLVGCNTSRGELRTGDRCRDDRQCARGLCVAGVRGDAPVCTVSCAGDGECPRGWSCHGVTTQSVLVCAYGGSTPFDPTGRQ